MIFWKNIKLNEKNQFKRFEINLKENIFWKLSGPKCWKLIYKARDFLENKKERINISTKHLHSIDI